MTTSSPVEAIKTASRGLRGTLLESLADARSGALADDDTQLIKFHGSYQQDDRDQREERRLRKLEPAFSFIIRTRLPGGIATPADAALMMQIGVDGVFVGSGIFKSDNPPVRAKAIVEATLNYQDPSILAKVSRGLGEAMPGLEMAGLDTKLADRGW